MRRSARFARERYDPSLAITPWIWFKKGTPMMLLSLVAGSVVFTAFFGFFEQALS